MRSERKRTINILKVARHRCNYRRIRNRYRYSGLHHQLRLPWLSMLYLLLLMLHMLLSLWETTKQSPQVLR